MGIPVLVIGKSGSGKSSSIEGFDPATIGLINVAKKPLPFRKSFDTVTVETDDYTIITSVLLKARALSIVIDDATYLMVNSFMRSHSKFGGGNSIFTFYNQLGDQFWQLVETVKQLPKDRIVYFLMMEDKNDFGDIKPKTIGKLLDEKVCVEGMFTILLRAVFMDGKHLFATMTSGADVTKSPKGMFKEQFIPNDLALVDSVVRTYYNLTPLARPGVETRPQAAEKKGE